MCLEYLFIIVIFLLFFFLLCLHYIMLKRLHVLLISRNLLIGNARFGAKHTSSPFILASGIFWLCCPFYT